MNENKVQKWLQKAREHTPKYSAIMRTTDHGYVYTADYGADRIQTLYVLVWKDGILCYHYKWNQNENDESGKDVVVALKNGQKLLIVSENLDMYVWGDKDSISTDSSVDAVVVFSSGTSGYLIFGSQSAKTVNVKQLSYWFENVPDSIIKIFGDIIGCIPQAQITSDVQTSQSIKNETEEGTEVV